jgi:hypothetical protein
MKLCNDVPCSCTGEDYYYCSNTNKKPKKSVKKKKKKVNVLLDGETVSQLARVAQLASTDVNTVANVLLALHVVQKSEKK